VIILFVKYVKMCIEVVGTLKFGGLFGFKILTMCISVSVKETSRMRSIYTNLDLPRNEDASGNDEGDQDYL
jgi:hypothetical protein